MKYFQASELGVGDHIVIGAGREQFMTTILAVDHKEDFSVITTAEDIYSFRPEVAVAAIRATEIN